MELIYNIILFLCYISIAIELIFLNVPSVASSMNIWKPNNDILKYYSNAKRKYFEYSKIKKIIFFIIPLILIYAFYSLPIIHIIGLYELKYVFSVHSNFYLLSVLIMIFGRYISLSSVFTIRTSNEQKGDSFKLHDDGFFSKIRNPIQTGLYTFFIGVILGLPNLLLLLGLLFYIFYMHVKIKMEEDFLSNKYGLSYTNYFEQTRRYI